MSLTELLPERVELCSCGHPKQWHGDSLTFCLVALDINEECHCKGYSANMTLLLGKATPVDAPTKTRA